MMKRLLLALLVLGAAFRAEAVDWTDIWYKPGPNQDGYGFNLVQSGDFGYIFVTFYVFGPDNKPIWYVAGLEWDGVDTYRGKVFFAQSGTFFGIPWNKDRDYSFDPNGVGTATFKPSATNNYQGTLSYTITNVGSSTVAIERQTLTSIPTGGNYAGGQSGAYSGCTDSTKNYTYTAYPNLTVTHLADGSATFAFDYGNSLTCTLAGTYQQHGQYYEIPSASYVCSDGLNTTATMTEIKATSLGIEGRLSGPAPTIGAGCVEYATFSAVLMQ